MAPAATTLQCGAHGVLFTPFSRPSFTAFNEHAASPFVSVSFSQCLSSPAPSLYCQSRWRVVRVSTEPVEYAPPAPEFDFWREIARLRSLWSRVSEAGSLEQRLEVVDCDCRVSGFFNSERNGLIRVLEGANLGSYELYLVKCLVAAGQEHVLSYGLDATVERELESARSSLKSALYALVGMIERWDGGGEEWENKGGSGLKEEEGGVALRKLLKILRELEEFYDCIGGIIG